MLSNEERALWKAREEAARAAKRKGGKGAAPAPVEPPKKAAPAKKAAAPVEPPKKAAPAKKAAAPVEPPAPVVAVEPPAAPAAPAAPVELVAAPPVVGELSNPFNEQPAPVEPPAPPAPPAAPAAPVVAVEPSAAPPKKARAKKAAPAPAPADAAAAAAVAQIAADALASAEDAPAPVRGRAARGCWLTVGEGEDRARINAARVVAVSRDRVTAGSVTAYHTVNLRLYTAPVEDADGAACWDDFEIPAATEEDAARTFDRLWDALEPHGFLRVGDAHDEHLINPAHIQMITLERWEAVKAGKKTPAQPAEWIAQIVYSWSSEEGFTQAVPLRYLSSAARDRVVAALGELLGWSPDDPALDE